ncbi:hypothetical protein D1814_00130 [Alteromonas sp. BL110]|uniref:hypothetical protein n=1 Tax=Alteromonas sp. BL110 TaxID=1714845 RepID=UPI000E508CE3|nr:hypothetical protein [Alteromonas sp. BL110]AXT37209.1 hypothetical protein D1814_00130 [Alteromonas sp. BL110]RKM79947.1 hypothetical protein D7031_13480 [Alteromonas sp. BL110]
MNISYRQLLSSIALIFASFSVNSAIVTYNFNGFVSEVENSALEFFDPFDLLGEQVTGSFTLDTSAPIRGRLETSYYWWSVHDNDRPAITSSISFGDMLFKLNNEGVYQPEYDEYYPEEMLEMYDGPTYDDGYIGDGISLKDYARKTTLFSDRSLERTQDLSFGFRDLINDFLAFNEDTLLRDEMPDFTSPVSWFDNDLTTGTQKGGGSLKLVERVDDVNAGVTYPVDSTVRFTLTSVETVKVSSPTIDSLLLLSLLLLWFSRIETRKTIFFKV